MGLKASARLVIATGFPVKSGNKPDAPSLAAIKGKGRASGYLDVEFPAIFRLLAILLSFMVLRLGDASERAPKGADYRFGLSSLRWKDKRRQVSALDNAAISIPYCAG